MRKFITTNIINPVKAPITEKAIRHINDMVGEPINSIIKAMIGAYTTNDIVILEGCVLTVTGSAPGNSTAILTAGSVYYNGEIYLVDANASLLTSNPDTYVWQQVDTLQDGVQTKFTNGTVYDFLSIRKMRLVAGAAGSGIADYNGATVKYFSETTNYQGGPSSDIIQSISVPIGCTGGVQGAVFVGDYGIVFQKSGSTMSAAGVLYIDVPDASANDGFVSGSSIPIGFINLELSTKYKGRYIAGASFSGGVNQGIAVCTNNYQAGYFGDIGFGNSSIGRVQIDENGNLSINNISPPGANKRIVIQFNLQYDLLN
jgi:hypothetical protein